MLQEMTERLEEPQSLTDATKVEMSRVMAILGILLAVLTVNQSTLTAQALPSSSHPSRPPAVSYTPDDTIICPGPNCPPDPLPPLCPACPSIPLPLPPNPIDPGPFPPFPTLPPISICIPSFTCYEICDLYGDWCWIICLPDSTCP